MSADLRPHAQIVYDLAHTALRLAKKYNRTASDTDPRAEFVVYQIRSLEAQYRASGETGDADKIKQLLDWWSTGAHG